MPERPHLAPRLRELDEVLAERGMPPAARARVEVRLRQEAQRRAALTGFRLRWLPALTFAAGAALVLMVVGLRVFQGTASPEAVASRVLGIFTVQGEGCRYHEEVGDTVLDGTCRLVAPSMAVHTWERARLRDDEGTVELREGTAMFDVTEVEAGQPPTRIRVSHGIIEVLGTRFTIEQGPRGGHVDLFEGRIRFIGLDGSSTEIAPGQRYTWGETLAALTLTPPPTGPTLEPSMAAAGAAGGEASTEPAEAGDVAGSAVQLATEASGDATSEDAASGDAASGDAASGDVKAKATRRARPRTRGVDEPTGALPSGDADEATMIIEEVTRLRAQGRYVEAAGVLRRADGARRWDRRTAQVLSYELGDIIERHLGDERAACEHWARHQERFAGGRYARAVSAAQQRLGCPSAAE